MRMVLLVALVLVDLLAVTSSSSISPAFEFNSIAHHHHRRRISGIVSQRQATTIGASDAAANELPTSTSKRRRVLNLLGLRNISRDDRDTNKSKSLAAAKVDTKGMKDAPSTTYEISTISELHDYFNDIRYRFRRGQKRRTQDGSWDLSGNGREIDHAALLSSLSVKGDTQIIGCISNRENNNVIHPVVQLLHDRRRRIEVRKQQNNYNNNKDEGEESQTLNFHNRRNITRTLPLPDDGYKIALAIEGGGMRGCVTAGMVAAVHHLSLSDTIDVVYGSSAGTVIGAYFITRQLPWFGPELYYDALTTAGDRFINAKRFLRAVGLGLLDPRLTKDVIFRRNHGKPVLDLTYLLNTTMQENKPLDWTTFEEMQAVQPLKVMASGLKSQRAFIMDMARGSFSNIEELACCMRASCLLPGVSGPVINMKYPREEESNNDDGATSKGYDMRPRNRFDGGDDYEPLADALLFEPLPYRAAIKEGATHVICLRSRPDGVDVTGKSSIFEKMIIRRFFLRKNSLRSAYDYMKRNMHKKLYAEQVIELNEGAKDIERPYSDTSKPHLLPIALPPGSAEVSKLETGREAIFRGVRRGFARAYDSLVEDPNERGKGMEVAALVFPEDMLNYDPLIYTSQTESAYENYLKSKKTG